MHQLFGVGEHDFRLLLFVIRRSSSSAASVPPDSSMRSFNAESRERYSVPFCCNRFAGLNKTLEAGAARLHESRSLAAAAGAGAAASGVGTGASSLLLRCTGTSALRSGLLDAFRGAAFFALAFFAGFLAVFFPVAFPLPCSFAHLFAAMRRKAPVCTRCRAHLGDGDVLARSAALARSLLGHLLHHLVRLVIELQPVHCVCMIPCLLPSVDSEEIIFCT
jgi:hypothetical protein